MYMALVLQVLEPDAVSENASFAISCAKKK